jgi:Flp pilus assembly protein TadG
MFTSNLAYRAFDWFRRQDGVAAIEFALIASFLSISALNVADLASYSLDRLEVENAAAIGTQAAWKTCPTTSLPATVNCSGLNSAVTTAIQSTSLGTKVSLVSGSPAEAYYCVNSSGVLTSVGAVTATKPSDCSSVGVSTNTPGDYLTVQVTYTYSSLFTGVVVAGLFGGTITKTSWMRLD